MERPSFVKIYWQVFLTMMLTLNLLDAEQLSKNLAILSRIDFWIVIQNLVVVIIVLSVAVGLIVAHPFFGYSWLFLFRDKTDEKEPSASNVYLLPAKTRYFGVLFILLLMINIPYLCQFEEWAFRTGTATWSQAIWNSFVFGAVHWLVGVPIGATLAISIAGFWFSIQYFNGGVDLSTLHHTTYNMIILTVLLGFAIGTCIRKPRPKTAWERR